MERRELEDLLIKEFLIWDENKSPNRGLKRLEINRASLMYLNDNRAANLVHLLKNELPEDAAVYDNSGERLINLPGKNDTGSGQFYIDFASEEWPLGGVIGHLAIDSLIE
jgi:hypothetical protein